MIGLKFPHYSLIVEVMKDVEVLDKSRLRNSIEVPEVYEEYSKKWLDRKSYTNSFIDVNFYQSKVDST